MRSWFLRLLRTFDHHSCPELWIFNILNCSSMHAHFQRYFSSVRCLIPSACSAKTEAVNRNTYMEFSCWLQGLLPIKSQWILSLSSIWEHRILFCCCSATQEQNIWECPYIHSVLSLFVRVKIVEELGAGQAVCTGSGVYFLCYRSIMWAPRGDRKWICSGRGVLVWQWGFLQLWPWFRTTGTKPKDLPRWLKVEPLCSFYAGVSSKHSDMVAVSQEGQETNWHRTFAVFHLISCSIWGCNRRSQQKNRLRGSRQQLLSHLKGAPLDMRKWNNHRAVLRLLEECSLLYFICFALWVAGPWTSCAEVICLCNVKANTCWYIWRSRLCSLGSNLGPVKQKVINCRGRIYDLFHTSYK